ncbi:MAG: DNA gyrase subunit A [Armatimonadota bacterium]
MPEAAKPLEEIEAIDIGEEMSESYVAYAMHTIVDRALPDVRDGLKPSQRRVLLTMNDLNLGPDSAHRKCAKIVGDCTGQYHPHGQEVIYPTLVRMGQDFNARYPLVDPQGNFGTVDGHPPGAMRYTEARMSPAAVEMLRDIDKETVDTQPTFDETHEEAVVLPARFPNLLCNGASGIAVGMATSIPPHNLAEVCDGLIYLLEHPKATLKTLMRRIQGPDFPTGGMILGLKGIREAYQTGRASITMQARAVIEPLRSGRNAILVTELPYQVSKSTLIEQIVKLVQGKRVDGVAAVRDESDRKGLRVVIELRREANPNVVLNQLYKRTLLRTSFSVYSLALVNGVPRTLSLPELMQHWLDHRREVILRRTAYLLQQREARLHIVEGLIKASDHIDEVIALIRKSKDRPTARAGLQKKFKLTERQAQAIIEMVLGQLTGLDQSRLRQEAKDLKAEITYLKKLLAEPEMVTDLIKEDLRDLKKRLGDERRTRIVPEEAEDISTEDLIAEEDMVITITRDGYVKRLPLDTYRVQQRGGRGVVALTKKEEDTVEHLFVATTHHTILCFTNQGRVYQLKAYQTPMASRQARGTAIINLLQLESGEEIQAFVPVKGFEVGGYLIMATRNGMVKKTALEEYDTPLKTRGIIAISVDKNDDLEWVKWTDGKQHIVLVTHGGYAVRFDEKAVRPMGRNARGVIGVRLRKRDHVVGMLVVEPKDKRDMLVVTEKGMGKRTKLSEYACKGRGIMGVKTLQITRKNGPLVGVQVVEEEDEVMALSSEGVLIRMPVEGIRQTGRATQGVKLVSLPAKATVRAVTKVVREAVDGE